MKMRNTIKFSECGCELHAEGRYVRNKCSGLKQCISCTNRVLLQSSKCRSCSIKGKKHSEVSKRKMSEARRRYFANGNPHPKASLGKKHTEETKEKIRRTMKKRVHEGLHHNYKGGITPLVMKIRTSPKMKTWRTQVFERDNYTCQICHSKSGGGKTVVLNADHIRPFSLLVNGNNIQTLEQAEACQDFWDINNGRTLCLPCHKKTYSVVKFLIKEFSTPLL